MTENVRYLCDNLKFFVSCIPNAGIPENVGGHAHYKETPESLAADLLHFARDYGVNIIGGCCGTTPAHLKAVVESVANVMPKRRDAPVVPAASSLYIQQPYEQDNSFLIIGERVNASGSKKCRDLLNAEDWDGLVSLAKEQVTRRRAHTRRERGFRRARRRERHARGRFASRNRRATSAHVRLDRVGKNGSRT
jgi:5-methyltetrahydrofolate--homocysteine methyltransferase